MLMTATKAPLLPSDTIVEAANRAARAIPPLWPLASSVAVNPFLGQTGEPLATAAARLRRVAGIALTMPRAWYAERLRSGEIADEDLQAAFDAAPAALRPKTFAALKQAAQAEAATPHAVPTVADLARDVASIDWPGIVNDRISHWASGYFDQGQALWAAPQARSAYAAWRAVATHDLTPEIAGLAGFAQSVADAPTNAEDALVECVARLGLSEAALESYFHRLLTSLGGWGQVARYRLWQAELSGGTDASVTDLLAIRMIWEAALLRNYGSALEPQWQAAIAAYAEPVSATPEDVRRRHPPGGCRTRRPAAAPDALRRSAFEPRQHLVAPRCRWPSASTCVRKSFAGRWKASIPASGRWDSPGSSGWASAIAASPRMWSRRACRCC